MPMKSPVLVLLSVVACCLISACAHRDARNTVQLSGIYIEEFERREFISCDGGTRYWVDNPNQVRGVAKQAQAKGMALQIAAVVSRGEAFGHNFGYDLSIRIDNAKAAGNSSTCQIMEVQR